MRRKYTEHGITDSSLRQLAAAAKRESGSLFPGIGYGAPSNRAALIRRGLAEEKYRDSGKPACGYCKTNNYDCWHNGSFHDVVITDLGREALAAARAEGW